MNQNSEAICPACGAPKLGGFVQHGSYFTRCMACGEEGPATSWLALSENMCGNFRAIIVDENLKEIEVLGEGKANEIASLVSNAAHKGKGVKLVASDVNA